MRFLFILLLFLSNPVFASDTAKLYNPYANVEKDVAALLVKAKEENKNVLLQVGGNWCIWCYRLNSFLHTDTTLKRLLNQNYLLYHLNYSKENRNETYLKKLNNPQRYGFPVLVVLDSNGRQLHTQDTGLLEKGNGYDTDKIKSFLLQWLPWQNKLTSTNEPH